MRKSVFAVIVITLLSILAVPTFAQDELPTIAEIVVASTEADPAEFTILLAAVSAADPAILETLANPDASLTVFAPTDAAFAAAIEALGVTAEDLLANTELLNTVLSYHVVPGAFAAEDLLAVTADGASAVYGTVLANQGLVLVQDGESLLVNDATVVAADVQAANGVVHVIDSVLLPNTEMMEAPMGDMEAPTATIGEVVIASAGAEAPEFTILLAAVQAADPSVLAALTEGGPYTVFAPTDAAFAAALEALGVTAEDLLADTDLLTTVLAYHVVPGAWDAASVVAAAGEEGVSVGTLLPGTVLNIALDGESVTVNDATVVATDVMATNGIIHVIDAVLLPPM